MIKRVQPKAKKPTLRIEYKKPEYVDQFQTGFRTHEVFPDGEMHSKPSYPGGIDLRHSQNDERIQGIILKRAARYVRRGKIRIVPSSFQHDQEGRVSMWTKFQREAELNRFLERPSVTKKKKKETYLDLMEQLAYLHTKAMVAHNDVYKVGRNANIIMWKGKPHFFDFGLSADISKSGSLKKEPGPVLIDIHDMVSLFEDHLTGGEITEGVQLYSGLIKRSPKAKDFSVALSHLNSAQFPENLRKYLKQYYTKK